jgi:hypothetical protein
MVVNDKAAVTKEVHIWLLASLNRIHLENLIVAQLFKFPAFYELEGWWQCSQKPVTRPALRCRLVLEMLSCCWNRDELSEAHSSHDSQGRHEMHAHLSSWSTLSLVGSVARLVQFPNIELSAHSLVTAVKAQKLGHESFLCIVIFSFLIVYPPWRSSSIQSSLGLRAEFVPRKLFVQRKLVKQKLFSRYFLSYKF